MKIMNFFPVNRLKNHWLAGAVFILGIFVSFVFYWQLRIIDEKKINENFIEVAQKQANHLRWNLTNYTNALHSAVDLFSSKERVDIDNFHSIARTIRQRYPEVLALEWLPRVGGDDRRGFEAGMRERYQSHYEITELGLDGQLKEASERDRYYPVTFVEPFAKAPYNQRFLGFDHFSMHSRRLAIQLARDRGSVTATPSLVYPRMSPGGRSIQTPENNLGVIFYKPVFTAGEQGTAEGEKHEEPAGVIALLLKVQSVMAPVFEQEEFPHNMAVFEHLTSPWQPKKRLIYTNRSPDGFSDDIEEIEAGIDFREQLPVLNQRWSVIIWPGDEYLASRRSWAPLLALFLGLLLTAVFTRGSYRLSGEFRGRQQRFHSVIDSAKDAIVSVDKQGLVRLWNPAAMEIFGYESEEMIGTPLAKIISDSEWEKFQQEMYRADAEELDFFDQTVELTGHRRDGSEIPIDVRISTWEQFGEPYFTFIIRDITERKKKEEQLRELNIDLEKKVKDRTEELEQFVYAASHDLREPARVMQTYAGFLQEDLARNNDENIDKDLEFIRSSASQMNELIDSLLKLSRASSDELHLEKVSIEECVRRALEQQNLSEKDSKINIRYDDLPEVKADPALMLDLYQNLISNAVKYAGNDELEITLTADREDDNWILGVKDNGPGIEPEFHRAIFKPFKHLRNSTEHDSTGIGLSICRRIIERHGGEIWVESKPGEGAHFKFTIPRKSARS
ncbi:MAG: PAS domain S-box protein [bacterium]